MDEISAAISRMRFSLSSLGWDSAVRAEGRGSAASEERGFAGVGEALYAARRFVEAGQAEDGVLS